MDAETQKLILKELDWEVEIEGEYFNHKLTPNEWEVMCAIADTDKDEPTLDEVYIELLKAGSKIWTREEVYFMMKRLEEISSDTPIGTTITLEDGREATFETEGVIVSPKEKDCTPDDALNPFRRIMITKYDATYQPTYKEMEYILANILLYYLRDGDISYVTDEEMMKLLPTWSMSEIKETAKNLKDIILREMP